MYGWFELKPLFLGRLRQEQLTSNQTDSSEQAMPGGKSSPSVSLGPNCWGPIFPPDPTHIPIKPPLYNR